jgi:hypothetical protein
MYGFPPISLIANIGSPCRSARGVGHAGEHPQGGAPPRSSTAAKRGSSCRLVGVPCHNYSPPGCGQGSGLAGRSGSRAQTHAGASAGRARAHRGSRRSSSATLFQAGQPDQQASGHPRDRRRGQQGALCSRSAYAWSMAALVTGCSHTCGPCQRERAGGTRRCIGQGLRERSQRPGALHAALHKNKRATAGEAALPCSMPALFCAPASRPGRACLPLGSSTDRSALQAGPPVSGKSKSLSFAAASSLAPRQPGFTPLKRTWRARVQGKGQGCCAGAQSCATKAGECAAPSGEPRIPQQAWAVFLRLVSRWSLFSSQQTHSLPPPRHTLCAWQSPGSQSRAAACRPCSAAAADQRLDQSCEARQVGAATRCSRGMAVLLWEGRRIHPHTLSPPTHKAAPSPPIQAGTSGAAATPPSPHLPSWRTHSSMPSRRSSAGPRKTGTHDLTAGAGGEALRMARAQKDSLQRSPSLRSRWLSSPLSHTARHP